MRIPNIYNLCADPFERGTESPWQVDWQARRAFLLVPSQAIVGRWLESFKVMRKLSEPQGTAK